MIIWMKLDQPINRIRRFWQNAGRMESIDQTNCFAGMGRSRFWFSVAESSNINPKNREFKTHRVMCWLGMFRLGMVDWKIVRFSTASTKRPNLYYCFTRGSQNPRYQAGFWIYEWKITQNATLFWGGRKSNNFSRPKHNSASLDSLIKPKLIHPAVLQAMYTKSMSLAWDHRVCACRFAATTRMRKQNKRLQAV